MNKHESGKEQGIGVQELQEFRIQELPESAKLSSFSGTPELLSFWFAQPCCFSAD
jgi:hypothetical protein